MVYKKYIKRGNKVFGPYYYESHRVGNKVITTYIKNPPKKINYPTKNIFIISFTLLFFIAIFLFLFNMRFTGHATIEINPVYKENETLTGNFNLLVKSGELIPANTLVRIKLNEQEKIIPISELIKEESKEGNYYLENTNIDGRGEGYGYIGKKITYPEISFILRIYKSKEKEETKERLEQPTIPTENQTEETTQTEPTQTEEKEETKEETSPELTQTEPTQTEETKETELTEKESEELTTPIESETEASSQESELSEARASEASGSAESSSESSSLITGNVIKENEYEIKGKVSKDNPFEYNLEDNEDIEIIEESIFTDNEKLGIDVLDIKKNKNKIRITTDYYKEEKGFGKEYLTDEIHKIKIDLEQFDIKAEKGTLKVELIYNNETIIEEKENIAIEKIKSEIQENITEENVTLTLLQNIPDITIEENSYYKLNLSEYFYSNKEITYNIIKNENINTEIENNILTIKPKENYTGTSIAKIIAKSNENTTIETNEFNVIVTETNVSINITTIQITNVKINEPVKFKKKIQLNKPLDEIKITLPIEAENISIKKIETEETQTEEETTQTEERLEQPTISTKNQTKETEKEEKTKETKEANYQINKLTGNLILEIQIKKKQNIFSKLINKINLIGKVIEEKENIEQEIKEIIIQDNATEYEIEFEMPPAIANETI
ncbi:MAG: hypothetical protein QW117_00005, partial [Candidatus Pacearchaeota archaeon]